MALTEAEIRAIARRVIATAPVIQPPAAIPERAAHAPYRRASIHEAVRRTGTNVTATVRAIVDDEITQVVLDPDRLAAFIPKPVSQPVVTSPIEDSPGPYEPWDPRWPPILRTGLRTAMRILERGL